MVFLISILGWMGLLSAYAQSSPSLQCQALSPFLILSEQTQSELIDIRRATATHSHSDSNSGLGVEAEANTKLRSLSLSEQSELAPAQNPVLFVTHVTGFWPGAERITQAVDEVIAFEEKRRAHTYYLMENRSRNPNEQEKLDSRNWDELWLTQDQSPTYAAYSEGGYHSIPLQTNQVTIIGGYFTACMGNTISRAVDGFRSQSGQSHAKINIHLPTEAIFVGKHESLNEKIANDLKSRPNEVRDYIQSFLERVLDSDQERVEIIMDHHSIGTFGTSTTGKPTLKVHLWSRIEDYKASQSRSE